MSVRKRRSSRKKHRERMTGKSEGEGQRRGEMERNEWRKTEQEDGEGQEELRLRRGNGQLKRKKRRDTDRRNKE